jgi:hypothetical protein
VVDDDDDDVEEEEEEEEKEVGATGKCGTLTYLDLV